MASGDVGLCIHRPISRGYAPLNSPTITHEDRDGTCWESGTPKSDFLFIMEKIGPDEVALGRNAVGGSGRTLDRLLRENTPLHRDDITVANVVRCRPIAFEAHEACNGLGCPACDNGQIAAISDYGDNIDISASFDQIRECSSRYFDEVLAKGEFKYIICLGGAAAYTMLGRAVQISTARGAIYEPGVVLTCGMCGGEKTVPGKQRNCKECNGRGTLKCTCGGVKKHKKKCDWHAGLGYELTNFPRCQACWPNEGIGKIPGKPKRCPKCHGAGEVPEDPDKPHVCRRLKPGQLMMITYHPAGAMREPAKLMPILAKDFSRITKMEEELEYATKAVYDEYPPAGAGIAADILQAVNGSTVRNAEVLPHVGAAAAQQSITIDLETTGLDADTGRITHFAFTDRPGYGAVLRPDDERCAQLLKAPEIVGQNFVLFDWWWLERHGHEIPNTTRIVDTRYLGKLINPDTPNDLPYLTSELADPPIRGYWKAKDDYRRHIERVACIDVDATTRVVRGAWDRLERTGQAQFARDYIIPISRVVYEMRLSGMKIDKSRMEDAVKNVDNALRDRRAELPDWGGTHTEGQHAKVQNHLYNVLKLPIQKKRGTWKVTADHDTRETLLGLLGSNHKSIQHLTEEEQIDAAEFVNLLDDLWDTSLLKREFKQLRYRRGEYTHPELNPVHTATLRPGARKPAVLKVPNCRCKPACHGTEKHKCSDKCEGTNPRCKNARWVFIPDEPDWEIMSVDLSQAEVIGFLWYAEQWDVLDQILNKGQDAYQIIANKVFGRDATVAERDRTKVDTLAFIYGEGERTQALRLRLAVEEIRDRRAVYLNALPGVQDFRDRLINQAMNYGYVESPWSVRRYIRVENKRGRAANEACNAPVQNVCPMVTGHAMIKLHAQLPKPARLWTPWVYDELNFVYPKELRNEVYTAARDILGAPVDKMPASPIKMGSGLRFRLDFAVGQDWGHMRPLETQS